MGAGAELSLVLQMGGIASPPLADAVLIAAPLPPLPLPFSLPHVQLLNKTDLLEREQLAALTDWFSTNCKADAVFAISALQVRCAPGAAAAWATGRPAAEQHTTGLSHWVNGPSGLF